METIYPIGVIRTPFQRLEDCPPNIETNGPVCILSVNKEHSKGLHRLEECSFIQVLYWLGKAERIAKIQERRSDGECMGSFALRTPNRPNPIGSAVVKLLSVSGRDVSVVGLDCLDGTLLIDIKVAKTIKLDDGSFAS